MEGNAGHVCRYPSYVITGSIQIGAIADLHSRLKSRRILTQLKMILAHMDMTATDALKPPRQMDASLGLLQGDEPRSR